MSFAVRHRHDPAPALAPLGGLTVARVDSVRTMAWLQDRPDDVIAARVAAGHRAYVASLDGQPAAWGWVATERASIGELATEFAIPAGDRYLWNFVTLATHRGLGIYPRLLDAIVRAESGEAERFWIGYAPENHASAAGIRKAGFVTVAELSFDDAGRAAVRGLTREGGAAAARLLALPTVERSLAPCWKCIRAGKTADRACREGRCCCDYQDASAGCAA